MSSTVIAELIGDEQACQQMMKQIAMLAELEMNEMTDGVSLSILINSAGNRADDSLDHVTRLR